MQVEMNGEKEKKEIKKKVNSNTTVNDEFLYKSL